MREIPAQEITGTVARLIADANLYLGEDVKKALADGLANEESPAGKEVFKELLENAEIAANEKMPICQDTGFAVVFVELGQEVHVTGGDFQTAVHDGVRQGSEEAYLRRSILEHPIERVNTKDNAPGIIYTDIVPGDKIKITVAPKGGGSENMSRVGMLAPSKGFDGIRDFVIETASIAGSNPCPPIVIGVGIGGTFEQTALIAKKALLRELNTPAEREIDAKLEREILEGVNKLGIGPQGLGGRITALACHVESYPCHIATMPVAVNIQCHAARHKEAVI
jgi:fumarate hydratase subunit alpha